MDRPATQRSHAVGQVASSWQHEVAEVAQVLDTDAVRGLTPAEAARRLALIGPNALVERSGRPTWRLLVDQFTNTMILVLAAAGAITFVIGERVDTLVIAVIVVLNGTVGFVQEHRAERAMSALKRLATTRARVVRDGEVHDVSAPELVPGDVVRLAAGDLVPADVRLTQVQALRTDEAPLTGESEPASKTCAALHDLAESQVGDRRNMAFKGTSALQGRATGIVVATGMATELGRIAELLDAGTGAAPGTPLQRRLAALGRRMAAAAVVVCAIVFVAGVARGEPVEETFLTAVSLAVAAIPEGLPAVVTVALAVGARRMASRNAVVRRLPAVETLGSVTVICTDKTGTLTQNRMSVERVWTPTGGTYAVDGLGYDPDGVVTREAGGTADDDPRLLSLALVAVACNDASLRAPAPSRAASTPASTGWTMLGDPTEGALLTLGGRLGIGEDDLDRLPRQAELAFDADRRRMTTLHHSDDGWWVASKGALTALAPSIRADDADALREAETVADGWASDGYRVLALADARGPGEPAERHLLDADLHLAGLVAIADPPRLEVADAVATCRRAGMIPVMVTGDHPGTAAAIGRRLGLLEPEDSGTAVMTGAELDELGDVELAERIPRIRVFARTNPEQKLRIIDAWKANGAIVAMTGDGVNDAPALQRADIGVAMGITGTDVSKEASDLVLADDDFATIVAAVEEGRRIYDNIRRFVRYLLTTNSGEVLVMLLAPLVGLPIPLVAVQILWVNLVTDGLPAIALGLEPAERDTMGRPPRPPAESILGRGLWQHALWVGILMATLILLLEAVARDAGWPWRTMVFSTLAFLQLGHALAVRSERESTFRLGLRSNIWLTGAVLLSALAQLATVYVPALRSAFDTEALTPVQLAVVVALGSAVFFAVEAEKWRARRRSAGAPTSA